MESNTAWYILTTGLNIGVQKCRTIPRIIENNIFQIIIPHCDIVKDVSDFYCGTIEKGLI
jgi:hypothetical protein